MVQADELTGQSVTSRSGRVYKLGESIGSGGQAQVYKVDGTPLAVKLYPESEKNDLERRRLQKVYHWAGMLNNRTFVMPIDLLAPPHTGYVMQRVDEHVSLKTLVSPPANVGHLLTWYMQGATLSQRYQAAIDLADAFYALHQEGLHYQDLNFDNVLLEGSARTLRLIDCDNLTDGTLPTGIAGSDWFMAPEIVRDEAEPNRETDAYSLAVLLYMLLTLRHPLRGNDVIDGAPEDEARAMAGELPWVDHPDDDRNRTSRGIPPQYVMPAMLLALFRQSFEAGLRSPEGRATPGAWRQALREARDQLLVCPGCGNEFALEAVEGGEAECVWCHVKRPAPPLLLVLRPDRSFMPIVLDAAGGEIRHYQVEGFCRGREQDTVMATYRIEYDAMILRPKGSISWSHQPPTQWKRWRHFVGTTPLRDRSQLRFGPAGDDQRPYRAAQLVLRHR